MQATDGRQNGTDAQGARENALDHHDKEQSKAGDEGDRLHDGQEKPALANGLVPLNGGPGFAEGLSRGLSVEALAGRVGRDEHVGSPFRKAAKQILKIDRQALICTCLSRIIVPLHSICQGAELACGERRSRAAPRWVSLAYVRIDSTLSGSAQRAPRYPGRNPVGRQDRTA
jgi:hypothetical protein